MANREKSVICRFHQGKHPPRQSYLILTSPNLPSPLRAMSWGQHVWKGVFAPEPRVPLSTHGRAPQGGGEQQLGAT